MSGGFRLTLTRLEQELASPEDFHWVGLTDPSGRLCAVHRSMRWGPFLFFKGVFVREDMRGSGAAMQLAFGLRNAARAESLTGIAAWYEPGMAESGIADLLGMQPQGPLIHRVALPLATPDRSGRHAPSFTPARCPRFRGELRVPRATASGHQLVPVVDLFDGMDPARIDSLPGNSEFTRVHWVLDGNRMVLSAGFSADPGALDALITTFRPLAQENGADSLEVPFPASDIIGALQLAAAKARRQNRVPICLGSMSFAQPSAVAAPYLVSPGPRRAD
ncbi:hypothetical protein [Streptacidiphilus melanogenes]|uniref:hypothetical protein n=1 Tax=Streptacidiphilus melanogenes TaxID=411235 RepID=UPI000A56E510|nr:hypothetical protein [Streptacidiphilus melanogenes]